MCRPLHYYHYLYPRINKINSIACDANHDDKDQNSRSSSGSNSRYPDRERRIQMPTMRELLQKGETQLAANVLKYGGHILEEM